MHLNSRLLFRRFGVPYVRPESRVLEVAPDGSPSTYRQEVGAVASWETADLASEVDAGGQRKWGQGTGSELTYVMTGEYAIPSEPGQFDIVLSGQVIEHVRRPWVWMQELARVCVPGGYVITVCPVSWPYHEAPIDCWRIYPEGMRALCEEAGLVVELVHCGSEEPRPRRSYPGSSYDQDRGPKGRALNAVRARLGWPLPIAHDTITVARRPS